MLKITAIEEIKPDKNGRPYRVVRFLPFNMLPNGATVFSNQGVGTRTIFGEFTDKDGNYFKADGLWEEIKSAQAGLGSIVEGQIVTMEAFPYQLEDSEFESKKFTATVFSNENALAYINKQLAKHYSCVMLDGFPTEPKQLERPVGSSIPNQLLVGAGKEQEHLNP